MTRLALLCAAAMLGCASPTEPECPVVWYEATVRNAAGDSVGTWPIGVALCPPEVGA